MNIINQHERPTVQGAKYLWLLPPEEPPSNFLDLAAACNLSIPIIQTLAHRGFLSKEEIDSHLFMFDKQELAHPSLLADATRAVNRIRKAIEQSEKILIFGDYDVDGITATAMMMMCLLHVGATVNFYLPNRISEGYGLSAEAVKKAAHNGYSLIITVDNGITAFNAALEAKKLGVDLIITDHHRPQESLPEAYAIVNPLRKDCLYPCKVLAGVGVAFKVLSLLFQELNRSMPDKAYELLALGTIADVVPLKEENRLWVRQGLYHINNTSNLYFSLLKNNSNVAKENLTSLDIGFLIAPQINALGRLSDPRKAIAFLIGSDRALIQEVARLLFELNEKRKEAERSILSDIQTAIIEKRIDPVGEHIIMAAHQSWPVGIIGLVASRLVSLYGKPTILFHYGADGKARGSARSIKAFNLFKALQENQDILDHFGGHAAAAGLSLPVEKIPVLKERLEESVAKELTPFDLSQKLILDAHVNLPELTKKFVSDMNNMEPFGNENEQPLFYFRQVVQLQQPQLLKGHHVKCHIFEQGIVKPVIFFNRPELFDLLVAQKDEPFDLAAYVVENHWNGRVTIELQGMDIATGP